MSEFSEALEKLREHLRWILKHPPKPRETTVYAGGYYSTPLPEVDPEFEKHWAKKMAKRKRREKALEFLRSLGPAPSTVLAVGGWKRTEEEPMAIHNCQTDDEQCVYDLSGNCVVHAMGDAVGNRTSTRTVTIDWDKLPSAGSIAADPPKFPPMERPSFDSIYMQFAKSLSGRSTCTRAHVGCVVVSLDNHQVLSLGYNGGARGVFNDCLSTEPGKCGHLHSEINALIKLDYNNPVQKKLYTTMEPCFACSVAIVNAGIKEVIYLESYRDHSGLELLKKANIPVRQFAE